MHRRKSGVDPTALLLVLSCPWLGACTLGPPPAELVLLNGKIVTVDAERPQVEALAIRDGVVVALGSTREIRRHVGDWTEVLDLKGRLALPGFIDAHAHFIGLGRARMNVDLRDARTWDEVVDRIARVAEERPSGSWILGWGWHQEKWDAPPVPDVEGYPVHDALSAAVPDHPVLLKHAAGSHAGLVNRKAMELAGIDETTPDPPGGTILRDARGRPTGVLRENAYQLALDAEQAWEESLSPVQRAERERSEIELASDDCLSHGVTSVHDAGSSFETVDRLLEAAHDGHLGPRLYVMLDEDNAALAERGASYRMIGAADGFVTVRAIKRWMDGALGSHGAWLLEPYSDLPESSGLNTEDPAVVRETAAYAAREGFQLCVHAIGDRANRETLDIYEEAYRSTPPGASPRWRIEHAQHLSPDDIPRFGALGVIASMQAVHCTSDGPWVPHRLGERRAAEGAYVWRSLLDSGAIVVEGTDAPIEPIDPIANFHAAVTRRMENGETFYPDQAMTREEALRAATLDAAYAAFEEDVKGSLAPGKLADIVVLSRDIMTVPEAEILDAQVVYTIVDGRVAYQTRNGR